MKNSFYSLLQLTLTRPPTCDPREPISPSHRLGFARHYYGETRRGNVTDGQNEWLVEQFDALLALLDLDVVLLADHSAMSAGASKEVRGAEAMAKQFSGRALDARLALVNGSARSVWAPGGQPRVVFGFTITYGKIIEIDLLADPERLRQFNLADLKDG